MEKRDIEEYDYVSLYVREDLEEQVEKSYRCLGWELISKKNSKFSDMISIEFRRRHKIKNKDELLYLQVCVDEKFNEMCRAEKFKYSKSAVIGISAGVLSLIFTIIFINFLVGASLAWECVLYSLVIALFACDFVYIFVALMRVKKLEEKSCKLEIKRLKQELEGHLKQAKKFLEVEHE